MLITSRCALEYQAMFNLSYDELVRESILDCCAGGSSFAAETGDNVTALDPVYALSHDVLSKAIEEALSDGDRMIEANTNRFDWSWYMEPATRAIMRRSAGSTFLADLQERPSRYVAGSLPDLPFETAKFDLVLCSHLLFTWADHLDEEWHREALRELMRVTKHEVRIYPLVIQGTGQPVEFLENLREYLHISGHQSSLEEVLYRFQRGAKQMLRIKR